MASSNLVTAKYHDSHPKRIIPAIVGHGGICGVSCYQSKIFIFHSLISLVILYNIYNDLSIGNIHEFWQESANPMYQGDIIKAEDDKNPC